MQNLLQNMKAFGLSFLSMSCVITLTTLPSTYASDHVDSPSVSVINPVYMDGQTSPKPMAGSSKPEDITDVYAFREQDQSGNVADAGKLCLVMTLNGLQAPGQSRAFSPDVAYQIKVATDKNNLDTTAKTLSFRFGLPNATTGVQQIYLSADSNPSQTSIGTTTAFNATPSVLPATYNGQAIKVFAGEMDDPFFLDFRVLSEGLPFGTGNAAKYDLTKATAANGNVPVNPQGNTSIRTPGDTFGNANVNAIVVSVPMAAFQTAAQTTFYVWGTTLR